MLRFEFQARLFRQLTVSTKKYSYSWAMLILITALTGVTGCNSQLNLKSSTGSSSQSGAIPVITSALSSSVLDGAAYSYQITATNEPTSYNATGLPPGLIIDSSTGLITGTPFDAGQYSAQLSISNSFGQGTANLNVVVSDGAGSNCDADAAVPTAAQSAGFNDLVFCDDFNSASTIDVNGSGDVGYNWYTNLPWGWGQTLPAAYSVSNSVLTVTSTGSTANWGLSTLDPKTGNGQAWIFGYMEARISFDPTLGSESTTGLPAVWAFSAHHALTNNADIWPELDIFEACIKKNAGYSGDFFGTLHQWQDSSAINYTNENNEQPTNVDWSQWHIVAVLWAKGQVTWYLDGVPLMTQRYSAQAPPNALAHTTDGINPTPAGVFNVLDTQNPGQELILGSGAGWPLKVDWVRVWQE